jgi:tRNA-2-methylthio-N6-dimethylallyladenosine synthase
LLGELNQIDGLWRIRFLTNHPKDMSRRLIEAMAQFDRVCPAVNLPAQAGSDEILRAMRRGYTVAEYRNLIAFIREKVPGVALSNDIIVGFPGESEAQFQDTVNLLADLRFDAVHIAAYSPRPGTIAARELRDDVPAAEKKRRLQVLESLQEGIAAEINSGLQGRDVEVLVEGRQKGKWFGRTRTDKLVFFSSNGDWLAKHAIVNIECTSPWSLQGTVRQ